MLKTNTNYRIDWIDNLKGFLLLCICLSHFGFLPFLVGLFVAPTGCVWVPTFFLLSGLLYSSSKYLNLKDYLQSKFNSLLIPYFFFFFVFTICDWNIVIKPLDTLNYDLYELYKGNGPSKAAPLWFIIRLFFANIFYYILEKNIQSLVLRILVIISLFTVGYYMHLSGVNLPFSIDVVFGAIIFISAAHIIKPKLYHLIQYLENNQLYSILFVCVFGSISWYASLLNPDSVFAHYKLNNLALFFLTSFCGSISVIILFSTILKKKLLPKKGFAFNLFQYIAINGVEILASHCYCIFAIEAVLKQTEIRNSYVAFIIKILMLSILTYFVIVPIINNKFYHLIGKKKKTYKESLTFKIIHDK